MNAPSSAAVRSSTYVLTLLCLVSFFNYMDRMVLAVLLQPIKLDLHLSDSQLGLLTGLAFALLYALLGLPLGRLADKRNRVQLLVACLGLWSLMTAVTGLARTFPQVFLARMGVGIGEAGCVPAAHSLIGDLMPPEKRALGISLFQAGGLAGMTMGLMVTGLLADQFGWRAALMIVGAAGAPLALLILLTVREPDRRVIGSAAMMAEPAWAAIRGLLARPALRHLVLALSIGSFGTYGLTQWIPAFFMRSHGLSASQVGLLGGLTAGGGAIVGIVLGGVMTAPLIARDARWQLWAPAIGYGLSAPLYASAFLAPSPYLGLALQTLAAFMAASCGGVALSAIQAFAEPTRRATAVALMIFASSLFGLGGGPWAVGALSDLLAATYGAESLRYALVASCGAMVWASVHFVLASRTAARDAVA